MAAVSLFWNTNMPAVMSCENALYVHTFRRILTGVILHLSKFILPHEKFLQFDWLRAVVFQLNLKYLHVKITNLLWVVV